MARELRTLSVPEGVAGERIDSALTRVLGLSRTSVVRLLEDGDITTNGEAMMKSARVEAGQIIEVLLPEQINAAPIPLTPLDGLRVVFDDDDHIVIDKPVGCAAHPSPGWTGPTVVGALMAAGYSAFSVLKEAFRDRSVEKIYHALIQGHMDPTTGTIDAPIDRHPKEDHRFAVVAQGKPSITHYEVIEFYRGVSLVQVELETGRTHQIRVHFSALNHPLVGDMTYGADPVLAASLAMSRPWLHAKELRFKHPVSGHDMRFEVPYPADLIGSLALLSDAVLP